MSNNKELGEKRFNLKVEIGWAFVYIVSAIVCILSEYSSSEIYLDTILGAIIVGTFFGLVLIYLPSFVIYHVILKKIISYLKQLVEKGKQRNSHTERIQAINGIARYIRQYFLSKDYETIGANLSLSKYQSLSSGVEFFIDTKNKKFIFYSPCYEDFYKPIEKMLIENIISLTAIKQVTSKNNLPKEIKDLYVSCKIPKIYDFVDMNRFEVIDKTTTDEKRSYTMESNSGKALMGTIVGSMLSETVFEEYATAGAIIGASGERKITENVEKKINYEFCVNIYLNDINESYKSFTFTKEDDLRNFVGILEYIKNNKE